MTTLLQAKDLCKTFGEPNGSAQQVLSHVDFQLQAQEFTAVMGPSGCGKSTLLHCISTMEKPSSGSVLLDGQELNSLDEERQARLRLCGMGFIFQQHSLLKNLTLLDNILLPAYQAQKLTRREALQRARTLMEEMGLAGLEDRDITQASGGQLQRAAICRALINKPGIIFGDEPTGALDTKSTGEVLHILERIHRAGTALLLVTHDKRVAARAQRVLLMLDGQIASSYTLGPYANDGELVQREEALTAWLSGKGL